MSIDNIVNYNTANENDVLTEYEDQIHFMMSYSGIRAQVLNTPNETFNFVKRNYHHKIIKPQTVPLSEQIGQDQSVICGVQSIPSLINILSGYRKSKTPLIYIYVNENQYLTFIIKVVGVFPLIIIKIPVNDYNVYVNPNAQECYYSFPTNPNLIKEIAKVMQYQIILRNSENTCSVDFVIKNENSRKITISNVFPVQRELINTVITTETFNVENHLLVNPIMEINTAPISLIYLINGSNALIDFTNKKESNGITAKLIIESGQQEVFNENYNSNKSGIIKFIYNNGYVNETTTIATESNAIYWEFFIPKNKGKEFVIESAEGLFRLNYTKLLSGKNHLYYVILSYLGRYLFIKMIWAGSIDNSMLNHQRNGNISFQSIFDKNIQILEIYVLREIKDDE